MTIKVKKRGQGKLLFLKSSKSNALSKDDEMAAYYVALLWSKLMMKVKGEWLCQQEKELWKMGYDISGRASVRPILVPSDTKITPFRWTLAEKGAFWFPRDKRRYRALWEIISCGKMSYADIVNEINENKREHLNQTIDDMASIYAYLLDCEENDKLPALPPKLLGGLLAENWAKRVVKQINADILLESYFNGVPVEHLTAL